MEVRDRSVSQSAGCLGDLGQPCPVLFFEAGEVTEAVEFHHRGPVKEFQQLGTDAKRFQLLHEVMALVTLRPEGQDVRGQVGFGVDDGAQVLVFPHDRYFLFDDNQRARSWRISLQIYHYLLGLGDVEEEVVVTSG